MQMFGSHLKVDNLDQNVEQQQAQVLPDEQMAFMNANQFAFPQQFAQPAKIEENPQPNPYIVNQNQFDPLQGFKIESNQQQFNYNFPNDEDQQKQEKDYVELEIQQFQKRQKKQLQDDLKIQKDEKKKEKNNSDQNILSIQDNLTQPPINNNINIQAQQEEQKNKEEQKKKITSKIIIIIVLIINCVLYGVAFGVIYNFAYKNWLQNVEEFKVVCADQFVSSQYLCLFSFGQFSRGIIAVGQFVIGVIAIGQIGTGVIFFGQIGFSFLFTIMAQITLSLCIWKCQIGFSVITVKKAQLGIAPLQALFDQGKLVVMNCCNKAAGRHQHRRGRGGRV